MANQLNPYLSFDGTAREAMTFYQQVLGGKLELMTFAQYGMEGPGSVGIMHSTLTTDEGFALMASDLPPGMELPTPGAANVNVSLSGDDAEALRRYWEGLAVGATITMPLEKQMWGDEFGSLIDRYGIAWVVNIATGGDQA